MSTSRTVCELCASDRASLRGDGLQGAAKLAVADIELIRRAADAEAAAIQDVRVDHRCRHASMAEEFLDGSDVVARLEQVSREGMAEGVTGGSLGDSGPPHCFPNGPLHGRLVVVMPKELGDRSIEVGSRRRECPLPRPLSAGVRNSDRARLATSPSQLRGQDRLVLVAHSLEVLE